MTRIMVTGASGLLGVNFCMEAAAEYEVIGLTHTRDLKGSAFRSIQADLLEQANITRLLDQEKPDWLVHCAALADLDTSERNPDLALRFNAELPGQLAVECSKRGLRFLHISTDAVFDGQYGAYREEDTPNPLSVYARTKLEGEYAVQQAYPAAIIVRTVFFGWSLSGVRSLAEQFLKRLMAGDSMPGHTDRIFSPLLANDLAQIILEMLAKDLHGLFHAESPDSLSKYDFGVKLASRFGFDSSLIHPVNFMQAGLDAARAPNLSLHSGKLVTALNHKLPGIDESIEAFYQLHQSSYPDKLRALLIDSVVDHKAA